MCGTPQHKNSMFDELASASVKVVSEFDRLSLSNVIYAFGLVKYAPKLEDGNAFFDVLSLEVVRNLNGFKPRGLSDMLLSYVKVEAWNPTLFKRTADMIVSSGD